MKGEAGYYNKFAGNRINSMVIWLQQIKIKMKINNID